MVRLGGRKFAVIVVAFMSSLLLFSQTPVKRAQNSVQETSHHRKTTAETAAKSPIASRKHNDEKDSLVSLLSAQSMQLLDIGGVAYRKVTGPARFLHNNTYLVCDTALWNTVTEEIEAIGNVKIIQEQTVLSSDRLTYFVNLDLAQFRGNVVQLEDKDKNMLRTSSLDYNTKDSIAIFQDGGALRDKDGQIIESRSGTYDSKVKTFTFTDDVNMFMDSIFVKTTRLVYESDINVVTFGYMTDAWKDDNMLSSNAGWYNRNVQLFLFNDKVHAMSPDREAWSDSLFFYRDTRDIEMLGQAQLTDTTRQVSAVGDRILYTDSLSQIFMNRNAAIIAKSSSAPDADTVYFGADSLYYHTVERFMVDSIKVVEAQARLNDIRHDAVTAYRQKAAEEAAARAAEAAKNDPTKQEEENARRRRAELAAKEEAATGGDTTGLAGDAGKQLAERTQTAEQLEAVADSSVHSESDSLSAGDGNRELLSDSLTVAADSSGIAADSLIVAATADTLQRDSTKIGFVKALSRVKLYRKDIQIACDSLEYTDLDSLVRMYKRPVIWNEDNRQYSADSIFTVIKDGTMQKASLMSEAFVIIEEAPKCYDQIRSTEMLAYFDTTGALSRFDALGDANTVFYLKEDSTLATVNKSQAKMLSAVFVDGDIDNVYYFENVKVDGYPLAQMTPEDQILKGFNWDPDSKPTGPQDITNIRLRATERPKYASRPRASFKETDIYYPGYMQKIYKEIAAREAAKSQGNNDGNTSVKESIMQADTLVNARDSIVLADSLNVVLPAVTDSLGAPGDSVVVSDSLKPVEVHKDSTVAPAKQDTVIAAAPVKMLSDKELKAQARAEKQAAREAKLKAKEAKWAQLDSLDSLKTQMKLDARQMKKRDKVRRVLEDRHARQLKEDERLSRYVEKYRKKQEKLAAKAGRTKTRLKDIVPQESVDDSVDVEIDSYLKKLDSLENNNGGAQPVKAAEDTVPVKSEPAAVKPVMLGKMDAKRPDED